ARLCQASGCGALVDLSAIPIAAAAHDLAHSLSDGQSALDHALSDGEDFELLLAVPAAVARRMVDERPFGTPLTIVGEFVREPGLWQRQPTGQLVPLAARGYLH
ncbi:MAG: thiamine-phosphate kinase, partial [Pirellulales bacterium]